MTRKPYKSPEDSGVALIALVAILSSRLDSKTAAVIISVIAVVMVCRWILRR